MGQIELAPLIKNKNVLVLIRDVVGSNSRHSSKTFASDTYPCYLGLRWAAVDLVRSTYIPYWRDAQCTRLSWNGRIASSARFYRGLNVTGSPWLPRCDYRITRSSRFLRASNSWIPQWDTKSSWLSLIRTRNSRFSRWDRRDARSPKFYR